MRIAATKFGWIRRGRLRWRPATWIVLLAFALQSYVTQTHIHGTPQAIGRAAVVDSFANAPGHGKSPIDKGALDCPFCQAIVHAGAFFTPAAPLLLLPAVWVERAVPSILVGAVDGTPTHDWHSRAPPQH